MFGKVLGFILFVFLIQFINGSIVESIKKLHEANQFTNSSNGSIAELIRELQKVVVHIANVTTEGEIQVKDAYVSIQQSLNGYERNITQQRADLVATIIEAQANASRSGKNISACVNQVQNSSQEVVELDLEFEQCRVSKELSNITAQLILVFDHLKVEIEETIPTCLSISKGNDERFRNCAFEIFDAVNHYDDAVYSRIEPAIALSVQVATECGEQVSATIREIVNQIKSDFNDCVSKV